MQKIFVGSFMRMLIISCVLSVYLVIIKREKKLCSKDIYFTLVACLAVSVIPMDCFFRMISKAGISILLPEDVYVIRTIITCVYVVVDSINLFKIMMIIWICGIFIYGIKEIYQYYQLKRYINRWEVFDMSAEAEKYLAECYKEFKIAKRIRIKVSPFIMGIKKPIIVVPDILVNADSLPFMLRHELIHAKRYDNFMKIIVRAMCILNWYNPVFRKAEEYIGLYCEISCDQEAVKNQDEKFRKQYGKTLISAVELQCHKKNAFVENFVSDKTKIDKRIDAILGFKNKKNKFIMPLLVFLFGIIYIFMIQITESNDKVMKAYYSIGKLDILDAKSILAFSEEVSRLTFEEYGLFGFSYKEVEEQLYYRERKVKEFFDVFHKVYYFSEDGEVNALVKRNEIGKIIDISVNNSENN